VQRTVTLRPRIIALGCALILTALAAPSAPAADWKAIEVVGRNIAPGESLRFPFIHDRSFEASYLNMPVFVARGADSGPTLCLTAGVHGDELNGVEVARRVFADTDPQTLRGTLIALPTINAEGVRTGNRYLSDRRDLNRAFPGSRGGSVAALIANAVFTEMLVHCDALVDLHTASNNRTNLPQIRADLSDPKIRRLAVHFGIGIVVGGTGPERSLRREASKAGIPAIIYEAGQPLRFEEAEIARGVQGIGNLMAHLGMTDEQDQETPDTRIYEHSRWIRAGVGHGGVLFPQAGLGVHG
jgi:predicted deacylase